MNIADEIIETLKFVIPALLVFVTAYLILKRFLENERKKMMMEMRRENFKMITPVRLQAYERVILYLERIGMDNLIRRVNKAGMGADELQMELIKAIRSEYDHNLSQQLYMSNNAWNTVRAVKEEMIKLIHTAAAEMRSGSSSIDLSKLILSMVSSLEKPPNQVAIEILKKEIRQLF